MSSTCLVSVTRNRYSVPSEWAGHLVSTRLYPNRVDVVAQDTIVASHTRLTNRGADQLRLAALHRTGAAQARGAEKRHTVSGPATGAAQASPVPAAPSGRSPVDGPGSGNGAAGWAGRGIVGRGGSA